MGNETSRNSGELINPAVTDEIQEKETSRRNLEDNVQNIPITPSNTILGNIVERKFDEKYKFDSNRVELVFSTVESELGFPKVFKLDDMELTQKVCYI